MTQFFSEKSSSLLNIYSSLLHGRFSKRTSESEMPNVHRTVQRTGFYAAVEAS